MYATAASCSLWGNWLGACQSQGTCPQRRQVGAMPALVAEAAPRGLLLARTGRKGWSESSSQGMEPSLTMSNKRVSPSLSFPLTRFLPHWFICPRLGTGSPLELHLVWLAGSVNQKSYFMAAIFGWATHRDGEETPRNPTVDSGASPGNPLRMVGIHLGIPQQGFGLG